MKPAAATSALLAGVQRRHGWFPGLFALERGWAGAQPLAVPVLFSSVLLRGGVSLQVTFLSPPCIHKNQCSNLPECNKTTVMTGTEIGSYSYFLKALC